MALQKQLVHLNLTGGLQKKDDQFVVIPSKLAVADNVEFDDASTVVRRGGQFKHALTVTRSPSPGRGRRVFPHQNAMVIENDVGLHKVSPAFGSEPLLPLPVVGMTSPQVLSRAGMVTSRVNSIDFKAASTMPYTSGAVDCAVLGDLTCFVSETKDVTGYGLQAVRIEIIDNTSGVHVYSNILTGTSASHLVKPRVVASTTTNKFYIYYAEFAVGASAFDIKVILISSTLTVGSVNTVTSGTTAAPTEAALADSILYDVSMSANQGIVGVATLIDNALFTIELKLIVSTTGHTATVTNTATASALPLSLTALTTYDNTNYRVHAFYSIGTAVLKAVNVDILNNVTAQTTVGTAATGITGRIAAYENSTTQILLAFDSTVAVGAAGARTSQLRVSSFTNAYGTLTECASFDSWVVGGRISSVNSRLYLPMLLVSTRFQSTVYVVDFSSIILNLGVAGTVGAPPHVVARIDYGESAIVATTLSQSWAPVLRVPTMCTRGNTLVLPYLKYETDLRLAALSNDTPAALSCAYIDFDSQLGHEEINGITVLAGACPYIYDGTDYVEENFHHFPEILSTTVVAGTGGAYDLPQPAVTGTQTVVFTYGWQDGQGNWHESGPSNEMSVTTTNANYSFNATFLLPPTQKTNVKLLMYRTQVSSTDTSLYLDTDKYGATTSADAFLIQGEQLYTTGGVLANTPAPACRHISTFQKRLVLSGCGNGSVVHWSKQASPGYGVEFAFGDPTHQTVVPTDRGRVVGTKELDDKLVVVCESGVGIIYGTGPSATGTQGEYSDFTTTVTEVGASWDSPKSLIRGPEGLWFRSPFGIRLISRGGGLGRSQDGKQAGAEVDSLVSGNIVAISGSAKQQLRFYQSSGTCLVWDYQWSQWTRFTGMANVDAVFANGRYYHLSNYDTTVPLLRYTKDTTMMDTSDANATNAAFSATIETPWLSFAGIQGYQRLYRLILLGKNTDSAVTTQNFDISVTYDFIATSPETASVTTTPQAGGTVQLNHHFAKQKCEAAKISVSFRPSSTSAVDGRFRLTDLTLQVGVKSGTFKQSSSTRF